MSFLTTTRLFAKPVGPTQWGGYVFDALFLIFLWVAFTGAGDLRALGRGAPNIAIPASTFVFFGALGICGIRLAMYVAMIRRNRAPQTAEWLVTLVPLCLAIPCFVASGRLVKLDARLHGYRYCYADQDRAARYVFAAASAPCPPLPTGATPD